MNLITLLNFIIELCNMEQEKLKMLTECLEELRSSKRRNELWVTENLTSGTEEVAVTQDSNHEVLTPSLKGGEKMVDNEQEIIKEAIRKQAQAQCDDKCGNGNAQTDTEVEFTCVTCVPESFAVDIESLEEIRFIFNTDKLYCCLDKTTEECNIPGIGDIEVDVCVVKIVGAIEYILNAYPAVRGDKYGRGEGDIEVIPDREANVCCEGTTFVDNVVGAFAVDDPELIEDPCEELDFCDIEGVLTDISIITDEESDKQCIKFEGRFELPTIDRANY
ncbi:CryBP1 protein [Halobacteroides halobius DSM 5150]|uniref:CryBP1 protein n=1 Tax=Halobacteroides halobius (strain ATCC 35273 / DSM 5150 / MD-1) TaxID=748449 RepID=L0K8H0_HALHC|nr:hypothetical protein [Halobacteroides halobius]AGB40418.1 CryBP1 protein [Halobacteroides halobius DSM 5150]